jgi:hypothetical protein
MQHKITITIALVATLSVLLTIDYIRENQIATDLRKADSSYASTPEPKGAHWLIGNWYSATTGYNMTGMYTDLDNMKTAGINWVRFAMHKPTGTALYDKLAPALQQRNMNWLANVMDPNKNSSGKYIAGTDTQRAEYKTWLATMVNRYKGFGLKYYEIHNEANLHYFWNIDEYTTDNVAYANSVKDYLLHLQDAYTTIKANDPTAIVVFGGISQWKDERFVDEVVKQNPAAYFDMWAFHPYGPNPTKSIEELDSFKQHLAPSALLAAKPILITEVGYSAVSGAAGYMGSGSTETTKATYLVDVMNRLKTRGVNPPYFWYNYNGDNNGATSGWVGYDLVNTDKTAVTNTFLPAYNAYKAYGNVATPSPTQSSTLATATPQVVPATPAPVPPTPTVSATSTPAPLVSVTSIDKSAISSSSSTISWNTNIATIGKIQYGLSPDQLQFESTKESEYKTRHSISLGGLNKNEWYYYRIVNETVNGEPSISSVNSFKTRNK